MTEALRYLNRTIKKVINEHGDGALAEGGADSFLDLDAIISELSDHEEDDVVDALHSLLSEESIEIDDAEEFVVSLVTHDTDEVLGFLKEDSIIRELL